MSDMIMELNLNIAEIDLICVNDNASNIKLGIKITPGLLQYLCDNHTAELAIGDTFKSVIGMANVLKKIKGLAKFTHQSNVALEELKKEASKEGVPFRKLKNPPDGGVEDSTIWLLYSISRNLSRIFVMITRPGKSIFCQSLKKNLPWTKSLLKSLMFKPHSGNLSIILQTVAMVSCLLGS